MLFEIELIGPFGANVAGAVAGPAEGSLAWVPATHSGTSGKGLPNASSIVDGARSLAPQAGARNAI